MTRSGGCGLLGKQWFRAGAEIISAHGSWLPRSGQVIPLHLVSIVHGTLIALLTSMNGFGEIYRAHSANQPN
jgi:hypothetical protein